MSAHTRGIFYYRRGIKFPSVEGWRALRDGVVIVVIVPHPPSHEVRHPPPQKWCGGHSAWLLFGHALPCHSRAGGNRAVVVISYLIWGQ